MFPERLEVDSDGRRTTFVLRRDLHRDGGLPVYELTPGGLLAYPTGKVWIRFAEGTKAADRAGELERAGFAIESSPHYAPHGAFVTGRDAAFALSHLDALRALGGIERVEPQMLLEASFR